MRFGLRCLFIGEPAAFRTTIVKALSGPGRDEQLRDRPANGRSGKGW